MDLATQPDFDEHEQVVLFANRREGFCAIVAIHSSALGPAMGGVRIKRYASADGALIDALRLSRGMTYKNALAGLDCGGGKAVIHQYDERAPRAALFEWFGEALERLGGRYVTAQDVGATLEDMISVSRRTSYVTGVPGKTDAAGADPGPWTALGVSLCVEAMLGGSVAGKRVAIQGLGSVGMGLAQWLAEAGARLIVADVTAERVAAARGLGAETAAPEEIHRAEADLFAPCALGAGLNETTIAELGAPIVCGAANNQLATAGDGARLAARGVTYVPDYLVNAGGIICAAAQYFGESRESVEARVRQIPGRLLRVLEEARATNTPPHEVADRMAEARIAAAGKKQPR